MRNDQDDKLCDHLNNKGVGHQFKKEQLGEQVLNDRYHEGLSNWLEKHVESGSLRRLARNGDYEVIGSVKSTNSKIRDFLGDKPAIDF